MSVEQSDAAGGATDPTEPIGKTDILERDVADVPDAIKRIEPMHRRAVLEDIHRAVAQLAVGLRVGKVLHHAFEDTRLLSGGDLDYVRRHAPRSPQLLRLNSLLANIHALDADGTASGEVAQSLLPDFSLITGDLSALGTMSVRSLQRLGVPHPLADADLRPLDPTATPATTLGDLLPSTARLVMAFCPVQFRLLGGGFSLLPSPMFSAAWETYFRHCLDLRTQLTSTPSAVIPLGVWIPNALGARGEAAGTADWSRVLEVGPTVDVRAWVQVFIGGEEVEPVDKTQAAFLRLLLAGGDAFQQIAPLIANHPELRDAEPKPHQYRIVHELPDRVKGCLEPQNPDGRASGWRVKAEHRPPA